MIDIRQTPEYAKYMEGLGWVVESKDKVNYFVKKFPIIGSFIKIQRPEKLDFACIHELIHRYRAFQIIIEPINNKQETIIKNRGFRLSRNPFLPSKTLHLGLTKSKNTLLKEMKKDARYSLRKTKNLKIKELNNKKEIESFRNAWKRAAGPERYVPSLKNLFALKESFGQKCILYHCSTTVIQGGAIFLLGDKVAYYWQAFTSKEGRKSLAQYRTVWEGILWAKKKGAKIFDFEGIYDSRFPQKPWKGFSHFKRSFGGYEVKYPGAFIKNRLPL